MLFTLNCSFTLSLSLIHSLTLTVSLPISIALILAWEHLAVCSGFRVFQTVSFFILVTLTLLALIFAVCAHIVSHECVRFVFFSLFLLFISFFCRYYSGKQQQCYTILINILRWDYFFLPDSSSKRFFFLALNSLFLFHLLLLFFSLRSDCLFSNTAVAYKSKLL